jgi:hypothetical protein
MRDEILRLQDEFDRAELRADADALRRLIADDFLSIGPRGFVLTKDEWIGRHVHFRYHELETSEHDVRTYGDTAIVRTVQRNKATYGDQHVELAVRVGQVWVRQDGWRLAAIQFSPLAEEPAREEPAREEPAPEEPAREQAAREPAAEDPAREEAR